MTELQRRPETGFTRAHVDETLVEPAKLGIRKFGAGLGTVALGLGTAAGVGAATFGAILMSLTTGFFFGVGAVFLAGGLTAITFGGLGILGIRRADRIADGRQLERRFLKLLHADGEIRDQIAARRTGTDVDAIRSLSNRLIREGLVSVDVDPSTGEDIYRLEQSERLLESSLSQGDEAELRGFEERVNSSASAAEVAGHHAPRIDAPR